MDKREPDPTFGGQQHDAERMAFMAEVQQPRLDITKVTDGLGYGDGSTSFRARKDEVGETKINAAIEVITSDNILVPISQDSEGNVIEDDGCGDGRRVGRIFHGLKEVVKKSLNRAKVFGGGIVMGTAARLGIDGLWAGNLQEAFNDTTHEFNDKMIGYGAHTDQHAHGPNCGCGAIDNAPAIISNAVRFESEIRGSIEALGVDTNGLNEVFTNYTHASLEIAHQEYSGKVVANKIKDNGKIVKELADDHKEMFIVLNMVNGKTVNQDAIREVTDGDAQAFAVDVWRLQEIAERMYPDNPALQQKAFLGELVYTLATAATLTAGDLPVYTVTSREFALAE